MDIKNYQHKSSPPSRQSLEKMGLIIDENLAEMKKIVDQVKAGENLLPDADKYRLYNFGCLFFDFYLLVEDCLLHVARTTDKWIPGSLDWHARLLKLMKSPRPEKRPPVLSAETALLLDDFLILYLNFHHQCSKLSYGRVKKMAGNLEHLYMRLEQELTRISSLLLTLS